MRIELLQHAVDRAVDQPVRRELVDILFGDRVERRREDAVLLRDFVLPRHQAAAERAASYRRKDHCEYRHGEEPGSTHKGIVTDEVA